MSGRGHLRTIEVVSTDDEDSYYDELGYAPPPRRSRSRVGIKVDRAVSPARRERLHHHHSYQAAEPENIVIQNHLNVPQLHRPRASSTGAAPQPNYLPIYVQPASREPSRERVKHYPRREHYESSSDESHSPHKRRRSRRRSSGRGAYVDPEIAKRLAKLDLYEEEEKRKTHGPAITEKLARLKALEEKRARDEEEAAIIARIDERKRKDKQREEALLLQYQEEQRQHQEAEKEAYAKAEAKRLKKEAEFKAERERLMLEAKDKAAKEKAERQRIIAEEREKQRKEEEEAKEERRRILLEEEERRKKEKDKQEELRKRILAEEEERVAKEKAKKKKEEEEFQQKVKERFMKAGYSPDYIEDILEEKKRTTDLVKRKHSTRTNERQLAIDMSRPTYIRVKIEHLLPETLDTYNLPWDYDATDERYILIKEYISHELQQELFEHTRKLKVRQQRLLITDGYVKDTVTTLKPKDVFKNKGSDEMFVVRRKSVSKSPVRRSWMFT
ncbi:hypothetical protein LTR70_010271 [Exophiala xenobiotica]|uniref:Uncharacterized protein n=1 Tax=Lithohypha guttulata TaxID=1690604 RepID=A0ABR0JV04_9EURO|nr:hypothetical protein LTR24_010094 [Lithohypha guttulata]KAK5309458.1 hypothetical protein LTR70_010271 [Exophiala xenobiotica]